ncbi:MAG TPA: hypothetical protein VK181_10495 [Rhizobium sp.]|nr:hypothetical protein [Rhizobium sp.]
MRGISNERSNDHLIGKLEGQMEFMQQQIAALAPAIETSRKESSDGRARIYGELEAVRAEIQSSKAELLALKETINAHKSTIAMVNIWKERLIGMIVMLAALSSAVGAAVALLWKWLLAKLGLLW